MKNLNIYTNLSYREKIGKKWKMNLGASFSVNKDDINSQLQNLGNVEQTFPQEPFASKSFAVFSKSYLSQIKAIFERRLSGISAFRFGGEYLMSRDKTDFSNYYISNAKNSR